MNRLNGKVALVSGAARGIGAETARKMAAAGASVVIGDVLADRARETAKEIADAGGKALALALDVTTEVVDGSRGYDNEGVRQARHPGEQRRHFPRQGPDGRDHGGSEPPGRHQHDGRLARYEVCAPALAESGKLSRHGSAVVNLASIAGIVGSQLDPLYSMTKGGVTLFTKSTALFFGRKGWRIRVNSIHPGVIETGANIRVAGPAATTSMPPGAWR
jgi:3(or 17)beta-hydroxysteroid dehydrogenase